MNKKLSRRDFLKLASVTSASLALSACGVKATELPTATSLPPTGTLLPTETFTPQPGAGRDLDVAPTGTLLPTETFTPPATLTSTPTLPLEQLPETKQAIAEFIQAFQSASMDITSDQLLQKGLEIRTITSKDKKQSDVAFIHVESSLQFSETLAGNYPLMIKTGGGEWKEATIGDLATTQGVLVRALYAWDDKFALEILKNQFNGLILDGGLHWKWLLAKKGKLDFYGPDIIRDYAIKNNLPIQGNHLIWGSYEHLSDWLIDGNFSKSELTDLMLSVSGEVVKRYKGTVDVWSVLNEYGYNPSSDFWYQKFGEDFSAFEDVFVQTHTIDPNAKLIFNSDGIIPGLSYYEPSRADLFWKFINHALENNIPLHGVGIEGHWSAPDFVNLQTGEINNENIEAIRIFAKKAKSMNLDVLQTEGDIRLNTFSASIPMAERFRYQGMVGEAITNALLEEGVKSIGWFGVRNSWLESAEWGGARYEESNPLLFDKEGNKKPLYYGVLRAFVD